MHVLNNLDDINVAQHVNFSMLYSYDMNSSLCSCLSLNNYCYSYATATDDTNVYALQLIYR